jgi:hypothetical protein
MDKKSRYAVPMAVLESVRVSPDEQIQEQAVDVVHEYLSASELDRARLLSPTGAGTLRV